MLECSVKVCGCFKGCFIDKDGFGVVWIILDVRKCEILNGRGVCEWDCL